MIMIIIYRSHNGKNNTFFISIKIIVWIQYYFKHTDMQYTNSYIVFIIIYKHRVLQITIKGITYHLNSLRCHIYFIHIHSVLCSLIEFGVLRSEEFGSCESCMISCYFGNSS